MPMTPSTARWVTIPDARSGDRFKVHGTTGRRFVGMQAGAIASAQSQTPVVMPEQKPRKLSASRTDAHGKMNVGLMAAKEMADAQVGPWVFLDASG